MLTRPTEMFRFCTTLTLYLQPKKTGKTDDFKYPIPESELTQRYTAQ